MHSYGWPRRGASRDRDTRSTRRYISPLRQATGGRCHRRTRPQSASRPCRRHPLAARQRVGHQPSGNGGYAGPLLPGLSIAWDRPINIKGIARSVWTQMVILGAERDQPGMAQGHGKLRLSASSRPEPASLSCPRPRQPAAAPTGAKRATILLNLTTQAGLLSSTLIVGVCSISSPDVHRATCERPELQLLLDQRSGGAIAMTTITRAQPAAARASPLENNHRLHQFRKRARPGRAPIKTTLAAKCMSLTGGPMPR